MRIKSDWQSYLHTLRRREIEMVFGHCPPRAFARGLELGAGDGFQSGLLARYVADLVVTDFNPAIEQRPNRPGVMHRACDAERVDALFAPASFDLVFSSNMLEHLPDPRAALAAITRVLADDGVAIHIVPSPFWKFCHLAGFYPNAVISRVERWSGRRRAAGSSAAPDAWDNNPKSAGRRYGYLRRLLWPVPHGVSTGNRAEFAAFAPARWRSLFEAAGLCVAAQIAGPVSSGYGFGLDGPRRLLERFGAATEYAYVTVKAGAASPRLAAFTGART